MVYRKMINKLQNYFGIAVHASTGKTVEEMKRELCIIVVNSILNVNDIHFALKQVCYQADQINGTSTYRSKAGIHKNIFFKVKPVFMELSDNSLLEKYLHGKTQNNNESLRRLYNT